MNGHRPFPILGRHYLFDCIDCDVDILKDAVHLRSIMLEGIRLTGATIITDIFHTFSPHGVSGVVVIAESHAAIHTWPEHGSAAVDFFSCSEKLNVQDFFSYVKNALKAGNTHQVVCERPSPDR
jgi:S-adenosylmethionine decarboxylase proenzyme